MSYTEFNTGKIKVLTRSNEETVNYIKEHHLEKEIEIMDDGTDFDSINYEKYLILHKDGIYCGENCQHMLCEYLKHEENEISDDICKVTRINRDEYEFELSFYNGGTCEEEILSEEVSKLDKEPYEVESEMVKINPRESYMILDVFQYALMKMKEENVDYLFCNYSKEEISKFGQQFGDMNLKNGW
jgi:hypothetical protein